MPSIDKSVSVNVQDNHDSSSGAQGRNKMGSNKGLANGVDAQDESSRSNEAIQSCSHSRDPSSDVGSDDVPAHYATQEGNWWTNGRVLSIHAPLDKEIHNKMFVLLRTHGEEGTGLLVEQLNERKLRSLRNQNAACETHVELLEATSKSAQKEFTRSLKIARMRKRSKDIPCNSFIHVERTYNLTFKHHVMDYGTLDGVSLKELRSQHIEYLLQVLELENEYVRVNTEREGSADG